MLTPADGVTPADDADAPFFSVAVCTWNRAAFLRRTLESHVAQHVPAGLRWELIVVDNHSTDDTARVLDAYTDRLPLRRVFETRLGLSHARNAAVAAARGAYVVWTDDDVFVGRDWLAGYAEAVRRHPDAALFGGPIRPRFEPDPPSWLVRALPDVGHALALLDLGPAPVPLGGEQIPFGANYVVRADEQRRHPYSPRLGRVGTGMGGGEETAVVRAILDAGATGWWVPNAPVEHLICADRQTLAYLRSFYLGAGASAGLDVPPGVASLFGRPRWAWRRAITCELRYRFARAMGTAPELWMRDFKFASAAWGLLRGPAAPAPSSPAMARGAERRRGADVGIDRAGRA
ncbi:hypothetical protein tb265_15940 [Gemmatimonadetes bacterium T265]|nr:hypothetical protein tb265_15940 [Gemmatimonadetes bacterium T265]